RGRATRTEFVGRHCGVVNEAAACRCHRRLDRALALGRVVPGDLEVDRGGLVQLRAHLSTIAEMKRVAAFYRDEPELVSRRDFVANVRALLPPYKGHPRPRILPPTIRFPDARSRSSARAWPTSTRARATPSSSSTATRRRRTCGGT